MASKLFPWMEDHERRNNASDELDAPLFTEDELVAAVARIKLK